MNVWVWPRNCFSPLFFLPLECPCHHHQLTTLVSPTVRHSTSAFCPYHGYPLLDKPPVTLASSPDPRELTTYKDNFSPFGGPSQLLACPKGSESSAPRSSRRYSHSQSSNAGEKNGKISPSVANAAHTF